ncbi:MAG TPA: Hsp33 family molecular chaperone HslO [Blastocatellia bacterium]|nr:Hsp33 family molecular chaperone HslO [Blastocatellia bacterium]
MADTIIYATVAGHDIRLLAGVTTGLVNEACWRHRTSPTASAALGRTLTGTLLLGMTQKDMERVTVQFSCDGPIGGIVALADAYGNVRGYVTNPAAEAPERNGKLNVAGIVGSGSMHVRREAGFEIGLMKEPYHGIVEIVSGEIAADFAYYLTTSEQIPSATSLGVFVSLATGQVVAAGGYMVQMMPGSDRALADELSARIAAAPSVTDMILAGATPLSMLETALVDLPIEVLETREVQFTCTCSRDRVLAMLASLERDEVRTMLDDGTGETVICHVCNESYAISVEDLRAILATN